MQSRPIVPVNVAASVIQRCVLCGITDADKYRDPLYIRSYI